MQPATGNRAASGRRHWTRRGAVTALALLAGYGVYRISVGRAPALAGAQRLIPFHMTDVTGRMRDVTEWHDKTLLINFWASWCGPCRDEIPLLNLAQARGAAIDLQVIGIAIDDPESARIFGDQIGITYPSLVDQKQGEHLLAAYGDRSGSLPFSVIIDRDGVVRGTQLGQFTPALLNNALAAVLQPE